MAKLHLFSADPERGMPKEVADDYRRDGIRGTACGYLRKVADNEKEVSCFYCLKVLERKSALSRLTRNLSIKPDLLEAP